MGKPHIYIRDNFTCYYCGFDGREFNNWRQLTIDHVIPISQNGLDDDDNLVVTCQSCNAILSRFKCDEENDSKEIIIIKKRDYIATQLTEHFKYWQENALPTIIKPKK